VEAFIRFASYDYRHVLTFGQNNQLFNDGLRKGLAVEGIKQRVNTAFDVICKSLLLRLQNEDHETKSAEKTQRLTGVDCFSLSK
jgi:hypothetical protein